MIGELADVKPGTILPDFNLMQFYRDYSLLIPSVFSSRINGPVAYILKTTPPVLPVDVDRWVDRFGIGDSR